MKRLMVSYIILLIILCSCKDVYGSTKLNILFIPVQQRSHSTMQLPIASELSKRGHNVYIILGTKFGPLLKSKMVENGIQILWFKQVSSEIHGGNVDKFIADTILTDQFMDDQAVTKTGIEIITNDCQDMWNDVDFMKEFRSIKFDMAFLDAFVLSPCNLLLPYNHSIPFVIGETGQFAWIFGEPSLPSVEPHLINPYSDDMSFFERVKNFAFAVAFYSEVFPRRLGYDLMAKYAPNESSWITIARKSQIVIVFRDFITEWPMVKLPHIVTMPGISFSPAKPLPSDLQAVMDSSEHVIILSFGSMGRYMPEKHIVKFIDAFRNISQTVVMSFAGKLDTYMPLPPNLHVYKWLPQNDILGHRNAKVFITHGGHNGQTESIYHGLPMITIPLYAEQPHNAMRMVYHGVGLTLNLFTFTSTDLTEAISEIITNSTYRENAKLRSKMLRELPQKPPAELGSDWIEYVARNGAEHLRSKAIDMPLFQKYSIDIVLFLCGIVVFIIGCLVMSCRFALKFLGVKAKEKVN